MALVGLLALSRGIVGCQVARVGGCGYNPVHAATELGEGLEIVHDSPVCANTFGKNVGCVFVSVSVSVSMDMRVSFFIQSQTTPTNCPLSRL